MEYANKFWMLFEYGTFKSFQIDDNEYCNSNIDLIYFTEIIFLVQSLGFPFSIHKNRFKFSFNIYVYRFSAYFL